VSLRFAVMGNPVEHSLSPTIHQLFAQQTGIELSYEKIQIDESRFEDQVRDFFQQEGKGLNITVPCKPQAFAMGQQTTPRCKKAKAANTLWMSNNELHADNTDGVGLVRDLARHLDLNHKRILILGAGGAARGILGPLFDQQPQAIVLVNRSISRAESLAEDFDLLNVCTFAQFKAQPQTFDLIINATSASLEGMNLDVPTSIFQKDSLCYDLAYQARGDTPFVHWAKSQNIKAVDGLGMLVEQAAEAYFIWHKILPEVNPVLSALRS
jgi:shikimate dehydrogenase